MSGKKQALPAGHWAQLRILSVHGLSTQQYCPAYSNMELYRLSAVPELLRFQLKYLTENFPAPGGIYLTEFGFAEPVSDFTDDILRVVYRYLGS